MATAIETWKRFISHTLYTRLPAPKFASFAQRLAQAHPLPPQRVADLLLRPTKDATSLDPSIPLYVAVLLQDSELIDVGAVLWAVARWSCLNTSKNSITTRERKTDAQDKELKWQTSYVEDEALLYGIAKEISANGTRPRERDEAIGLLTALNEWVRILGSGTEIMDLGEGQEIAHGAMGVRIALGAVLVAAVENEKVAGVLRKGCPTEFLKSFSQALGVFLPTLSQTSPLLVERLEGFRTQTLIPLEPVDKKAKAASDEIDQMIDSALSIESIAVVDLPILHSRAGLYIYLHSLLVGRPLIDDNSVFNYLHNRYQGDLQSTCTDLIMASFDVLANSIFRNEDAQTTLVLRSFLINKLPLLLATLSASMFPPLTAEFCITQALSQVDIGVFPTFSSMFEETSTENDLFSSSVRQDFCFACCLHGLIPEENISRLLGEIPMQTLPAAGRYIKEELVQQCLSDPEQAENLLDELEQLDGNVGAASQALTEMIRHYCEAKDTTSLKNLSSHLARKPSTMDIMLLFDKSTTILQPVCELLDGWRHDEDLGEYQPIYEEFGSILLLVLAFVHRYNLSTFDLGIQSSNSFIAKLLVRRGISVGMDELSDQEKGYLDVWIRGLFNAEGGGLGDEPMSACPPQDFYLLMPTLMQQIVIACTSGHLSDEGLKGGLEFLVDTFLLPSLVGAISWLASHLWSSRTDSTTIISILQVLISPSSISSEASTMLSSILNIIAAPLEHSLRWLQRSEPTRQDVEPLSRILKPHLTFSRTTGADHTELESWASTPNGGIAASARNTLAAHVTWSLNASAMPTIAPPSYTHRQILAALKLLGASRLLRSFIDEVVAQTSTGSGPLAIDAAIAFICAPDACSPPDPLINLLDDPTSMHNSIPQAPQRRLTLRDALRTAADQVPKTYKTDLLTAETVIRLFRRVEAQLTVPIHDTHIGVSDVSMGADAQSLMVSAHALDDVMVEQSMMGMDGLDDGMLDPGMGMGGGDDDLFGDLL